MRYRSVQKYSNLFVTYTHDLQACGTSFLAFEVTMHVVETRVCFTCIYINLQSSLFMFTCICVINRKHLTCRMTFYEPILKNCNGPKYKKVFRIQRTLLSKYVLRSWRVKYVQKHYITYIIYNYITHV